MIRNQTSLPDEYVDPSGAPSSSNGFTRAYVPTSRGGGQGRVARPVADIPNARFNTSTFYASSIVQNIAGENTSRNYLGIINQGTVDVFVSFGSTASLTGQNSLCIPPNMGITFESGVVPNNNVSAVASTSCQVCIIEGSAA